MHSLFRSLRENRGFSQDSVAEKLGITRITYAKLESGEKSPTLDELTHLADIFEVSRDSLISGDILTESSSKVDEEKYKQILEHCIAYGASVDGKIPKTKLAKLAYLVDFAWFYEHLSPLTGLQYRRLPQGPVPDAYFRAIDEMISSEAIALEIKGAAQMIRNIEVPSESKLSPEEIEFIKKVCEKWQKKSTQDIVDFTHSQLPWKICNPGENIPYELITQEEPDHVY